MLRTRLARLLIVALLAPALIALSPAQVNAAVLVGTPASSETIQLDHWLPGHDADCTVRGVYVVEGGQQTVKFSGKCLRFGMNWMEFPMSVTTTFYGATPGAANCSLTHDGTADRAISRTLTWSGVAYGFPPIDAADCVVSQVCLALKGEPDTRPDVKWGEQCAPINLGEIPGAEPDTAACQYGKARKPTIGAYGWPGGSEYNTKGREITAMLTDNPTGNWRVIAVTKGGAAYGPTINVTGETLGTEVLAENLDTINAADPNTWKKWARFAEWYGPNAGQSGELAGVQFWREGAGTQPNWATVSGGNLGTTDVSRCMYYYGEKIADAAGTTTDEPAGAITLPENAAPEPDLTPEPIEDDPSADPCNFDVTDPSTYASAGICQLVEILRAVGSVLGSIWGVLKSVLTAVVGLAGTILDGLMGLFTPHPNTWDWQGLRAELEGRPPFSLVVGIWQAVDGLAAGYNSAGSCGTLIDFGGGSEPTVSCASIRDNPAIGGLYALVQAAIIGSTVIGIGLMVSRSVGSKS